MATIKGQNLRILVGPTDSNTRCIAAATSCTVHFQAQTTDMSTKDTEEGWADNEVTGLSWDMSADALVTHNGGTARATESITLDGDGMYTPDGLSISVEYGQTIIVSAPYETIIGVYDVNSPAQPIDGSGGVTTFRWTNDNPAGAVNVNIFVAQVMDVTWDVQNGDAVSLLELNVGDKVWAEFSTTGSTMNRVVTETLYIGQAYITDLQITAPNRQPSTFSIALTGDGELTQE